MGKKGVEVLGHVGRGPCRCFRDGSKWHIERAYGLLMPLRNLLKPGRGDWGPIGLPLHRRLLHVCCERLGREDPAPLGNLDSPGRMAPSSLKT